MKLSPVWKQRLGLGVEVVLVLGIINVGGQFSPATSEFFYGGMVGLLVGSTTVIAENRWGEFS